jgi:DNA-directed RNA polymerase subunit M/transcription elongation factor TFIIS
MNCPNCGTPMNRHAEKLLQEADRDEAVTSIYCCPNCGKVEAET